MSQFASSAAWSALQNHRQSLETATMRQLFADDPKRFDKFSLLFGTILFDYSKNRITEKTMTLLLDLAKEADVFGWRDKMFAGEKINLTENRAVLHTALRNQSNKPVMVDG